MSRSNLWMGPGYLVLVGSKISFVNIDLYVNLRIFYISINYCFTTIMLHVFVLLDVTSL